VEAREEARRRARAKVREQLGVAHAREVVGEASFERRAVFRPPVERGTFAPATQRDAAASACLQQRRAQAYLAAQRAFYLAGDAHAAHCGMRIADCGLAIARPSLELLARRSSAASLQTGV